MGYLQNISRQPSGGKMGGILTIDVVRKSDVESIPAPVNGTVSGAVVLKAGAAWSRWITGYQSAAITTTARTSREGPSKASELPFILPLDRAGVRYMLQLAERDEFIVVYKDATGKQKIFGTLQAPVRFEFDHATGQTNTDTNKNNCRFFYQGPDNTYFYDAAAIVPGAGPAPAVVLFNGVAIASLQPGETLNILSDYSYTEYFTTS